MRLKRLRESAPQPDAPWRRWVVLGIGLAFAQGASGWRAVGLPLARAPPATARASAVRAIATPLPDRRGGGAGGSGGEQRRGADAPAVPAAPGPRGVAGAGALAVEPATAVLGPTPGVAQPADKSDSVAILLLNLGGPDSLDAVEPFLYNLFSDPEIITLPKPLQFLQPTLAFCIAKYRAPASKVGYASIGGASPLLATTRDQAHALEQALLAKGISASAYVAMRYWYPFTDDAVRELLAAGHRELVILPLYPQFSVSTSGSSLRVLEEIFYKDPKFARVQSIVIPAWYNRPGYVTAMARLIEGELLSSAFLPPSQAAAIAAGDEVAKEAARALASQPHIFFSAHGLPEKYVTQLGDPYQAQTEATVRLVMAQLAQWGYTNEHSLAYQSRVGPVTWLQPYTDVVIPELCAKGVTQLCVVPVSFVSEHIETLEEIDCEYRELAEESGIKQWARVPALGLDGRFIDALADAVIEALPGLKTPTVRAINEGTPVSLRIINDLVALSRKEELKTAPRRERYGFTDTAERINGRIAMAAIAMFGVGALPSLIDFLKTLES